MKIACFIGVVAILMMMGAMYGFWEWKNRQVPFDSIGWKNGDKQIRYRMKDSLIAKYKSGELSTLEAVDRELGPDDEKEAPTEFRSYGLESGIKDPWFLKVRFDDRGKVIEFEAHPS